MRGGAVVGAADGEVEFAEFAAARTAAFARTAYLLTGDHQLSEDLVQTIGPLHRAVLDLSPLSPDSELSSRQLYLFGDHPTPQLQGISVAAAALDPDPRESSPPDWGLSPRGEKLVWLAGGGVTLAIAVLVGGFVWWRRVRVRP